MHVRQGLTARRSMHISCTTHARDVCVQRAGGRKVNAYGPPHPSSAPRSARVEPASDSVPSAAPSTLTSTSLSRPAEPRRRAGRPPAPRRRRRRRSPRSRRDASTAPWLKAKPSATSSASGRSWKVTREERLAAEAEGGERGDVADAAGRAPPGSTPAPGAASSRRPRRTGGAPARRRRLRRCRRRPRLGGGVDRRLSGALLAKRPGAGAVVDVGVARRRRAA